MTFINTDTHYFQPSCFFIGSSACGGGGRLDLPEMTMITLAIAPTNDRPAAAHVMPKNCDPRLADTPISFPCLLIGSTNLNARIVDMADEIPKAIKPVCRFEEA